MPLSTRPHWAWLATTLLLIGNCSSRDVSLGDDRPSPVDPTPLEPVPEPTPEPTPPQPCELRNREAFCRPATDHCSGRILTGPGYECGAGDVCCEQTVGTSRGGTAGIEPPASGAGGQ